MLMNQFFWLQAAYSASVLHRRSQFSDRAMAAMANTQDQSRTEHFMRALRVTVAAISGAGTATLQARQLLITKTAEPYGEDAVVEATTGLATAYSLGSVIEFILSPLFGRLSDRFGRKPLVLFLMIGPACMRTLCAVVNRPRARIRLLILFCM